MRRAELLNHNLLLRCLLLLTLTMKVGTAQAINVTLPLYEIYPVDSIELRCVSSKHDIQIPIPDRWKVNSAVLNFSYINSVSLMKRNSQLVVRLNGTPLAQVKLDPVNPQGDVEVFLPKLLLQSGFNNLTFEVSQHYVDKCERHCAPELWTRLKLDEASVSFDYELRDVPQRVSVVANYLFDPKMARIAPVHMITEDRTPRMLSIAGAVSGGVAQRFDYKPVEFTTSDDIVLEHDNILIGTKEFVEDFLARKNIAINIDSPTIKVLPVPVPIRIEEDGKFAHIEDKKHALMVISGKDLRQLRLAVESFDILSIPFPDSDTMKVTEFDLPEIGLYTGKNMLIPETKYPFSKLNFSTYTYLGISSGRRRIDFRLPPDFQIKPNQYVTVELNFAYGAGFRVDSVFNVLLNDNHVAAIHLANNQGAIISDYKIALPTYLFKGGANSLNFEPALTPLVTEECAFVQSQNLFLTLFDSSSLTFPAMPHRVEMPRMDLMFVNGFPFTRWPDGYETLFYVTSVDDGVVAAAYNMMGMLSQKNGYPMIGSAITNDLPPEYQGELMVIGEVDKIPDDLMKGAPLKKIENGEYRVPYPIFKSWDDKQSLAFSTQSSEMGADKGMLMQFESPYKIGRAVVMVTGKSADSVEHMSRALLRADVQGAALGDLVLVDFVYDPENANFDSQSWRYKTTSIKTGTKFVTGKAGEIGALESLLASNPAYFWAVMALAIFIMSYVSYAAIRRHRLMRIKE